ncbi:MAG: FAD-binding oxidoreductase [Anaerolineales bacterium]|nr:FAD-binding oxidoreductase [Anaerolineales bacterium]
MFDVIVIGKGMMGSAAARYLSAAGQQVALLGPDEPQDWRSHEGVFSSHYDEGRITRILDADPVWARLAADSLAAYGEIERRSGIAFHHAVGGLRGSAVAGERGEPLIAQIEAVGQSLDVPFTRETGESVLEKRPFFHFLPATPLLWETGDAGYVNPRAMVAAQVAVAQQQGTKVIRETAVSLTQVSEGVIVTTDSGQLLQGRKVVVAAGAFSNMVLPRPLAIRRKAHMVLLAELDEAEQTRLAGMPTLIYLLPTGRSVPNIYMLPPVRYPDGRTYIKLGGGTHWPERIFASWDEIRDWFQGDGDFREGEALREALHYLLPGLQAQSYHTKPCILAYTAHERPYIDQIDERLYVVAGGCGSAAKSSDAIGHLGALLVQGQPWPEGYDRADFRAVFADEV